MWSSGGGGGGAAVEVAREAAFVSLGALRDPPGVDS